MLERVGSIDRSRRSVEGRVQPLGLAVPGWNAKTKGQQTLGQHTLGQHNLGKDVPAVIANGWIVVICPTSIAPSSMVVADCRAGSFAPPSEAACVFHLLHDAHKQVFSLRILDYGDVRAPRSRTQLPRTHFSDEFPLNRW